MLYNDAAVILGMIYALLPFTVLPIYVSINQLDLSLLKAAPHLAPSPLSSFLQATLPPTTASIACRFRRAVRVHTIQEMATMDSMVTG